MSDHKLRLKLPTSLGAVAVGDSLAVSGICLTVAALDTEALSFDLLPSTLARTTLGRLTEGDVVNLEPSLRAGDPLGGHFVTGHVDAISSIEKRSTADNTIILALDVPAAYAALVTPQGSITIDGVSLTVVSKTINHITVQLTPTTVERTTLGKLAAGSAVNLEFDLIARYVQQALTAPQ